MSPEAHVGRRTRRVIRLGDTVDVQISKVDHLKKRVDFRLATTTRKKGKKKRPSRPKIKAPQGSSKSRPNRKPRRR